jgi:probable F420-dependent oxidoreductase
MRFGLALPHYGFSLPGATAPSWDSVLGWAKKAEDLGFDSVWMSDHLFLDLARYGGSPEPRGTLECFTTLAALASVTQRIRLGTLVVCNDLRPPSMVAKIATTIDLMSKGRFELGIGAGWYEAEFQAAGVPFERPGVRIDRLTEAVQILKGMATSEEFSFAGRHYRVAAAHNLPQPAGRLRIWVGGKGDRVVKTAARYADGYNAVWAWTPQTYAGRLAVLDEEAERAGRNPSDIARSVGLYTLIAPSGPELEKRWSAYLEVTPVEMRQTLDEWRKDKLCGTPAEAASTIGEFEALGVEEVILGFGVVPFQIADPPAVEEFVEKVFPLCR